jgi:preprotein translocase subunit SecA
MAGRGTDIMLGGNPEALALAELPEDADEEQRQAVVERVASQVAAERAAVTELGGLYVLGTERHDARRIDNQLRGRSGRQGDPGASRVYLSLQDNLMRLFQAQAVDRVMAAANLPENVPIENKVVTRAVASAQAQLERQHFESRKDVLKFDEVLNRQRTLIYAERRRVLEGEDLREQLLHFMEDTIRAYVDAETEEGFAEEWHLDRLWSAVEQLYPVQVKLEDLEEEFGGRAGLTAQDIVEALTADIHARYEEREAELGEEVLRVLERRVMLSVLDRKWREHLYEMDYLRDGIGLRWTLGREPIIEYEREGFDMFVAMTDAIKEESVGYVFNLAPAAEGLTPGSQDSLHFTAPTMDTAEGVVEGDFLPADETPDGAPAGAPVGSTAGAPQPVASGGTSGAASGASGGAARPAKARTRQARTRQARAKRRRKR